MSEKPVPTPAAPVSAPVASPRPKSSFKVRSHLHAGSSNRLFDSQNNANGFWDEEESA